MVPPTPSSPTSDLRPLTSDPEASLTPSSPTSDSLASPTTDALEQGIIDYFVHLFRIFNLPKSVAQIYAVLFITESPLGMDDIMSRLRMSKGAVSQGLKLLRSYGSIRVVYASGDRRDLYEVELGLRKLATGFLKEQLTPHLEDAAQRLKRIEADLHAQHGNGSSAGIISERMSNLRSWQEKGESLLPVLTRILAG